LSTGLPNATPRRVLITGASSGLGRALALALAAPGAKLFLGGRDAARLAEVAREAAALGAEAETAWVDVQDRAGMAEWIEAAAPLDLAIANAGISGGTGGVSEPEAQVRKIWDVNVLGVLNTVFPAAVAMQRQPAGAGGRRGSVVIVASVASFIAAPNAPAYCASKAAIRFWGEAMAPSLRAQGVQLTVACPGYIRTPMTARNAFPMPGLMTPEVAAAKILRAVRLGRVRTTFPWWLGLAARLLSALPPRALGALLGRARAKAALPE
jgi:short-subunit dehydrogenase